MIEEMAQKLIDRKDDLCSNHSGIIDFDFERLETRIRKEAIEEVVKAKVIALQFLKDAYHVSHATTARATRTGGRA